MELYRVTIPKDDAWKVIEAMGNMGVAHFVDLNKSEQPFNLPYATRIKSCEEAERRLAYLINKCKEMRIRISRPKDVSTFKQNIAKIAEERKKAPQMLFDAIDQDISDKERFVVSQSKTISEMKVDINKMKDYYQVLNFVGRQSAALSNSAPAAMGARDDEMGSAPLIEGGVSISFVAGTINGGE